MSWLAVEVVEALTEAAHLQSHSYSKSGSSNHSGKTYVHGYTRKDGTHVKEYNRSSKVSSSAKPTASKHEPNMPATSSVAKRDSRGRTARSSKAKVSFMKKHPCPSTGKTSRACQGYVVDHIVPLKRGGSDSPSNMQWQTVQAAKAKDKSE